MTKRLVDQAHAHIRDLARRHALPPKAEQEMAALLDGHREALAGHRRALVTRWADKVRADPEMGNAAMPATLHAARQAVERFGGDRLKKVLDDTGLGSHPEIIRAFARIGKAMPAAPTSEPRRKPTFEDSLRAMYPSMYGNKI